jgi:uncharacterized protein (TIRG00374 family)
MRKSRLAPVLLGTVVTLGCAYLAVRGVDFGELGDSLRTSNYWWLLPAFVAVVIGFLLRVIRWRVLFVPRSRPGFLAATEASLVGQFFNNVLPLRAGDAARIVALHSLARSSRAETTGTVVIERFFDVLALLLLLFAVLPWLPAIAWIHAAAIMAIALVVILVGAVILLRVFGERPLRFVLRPLSWFPFLAPERVEAAVGNLHQGFVALRHVRVAIVGFAWTLASWLVLALSFWLVLVGFDLGLSPTAGLLAVCATGLSLILPSAPAAVGVFEAAAIVALAAYDVPQSQALSYALVVHAVNVFPFILAGAAVLIGRRGLLGPADRRPRSDGIDRVHAGGEDGVRFDIRRTGDDEHDVAEPADRHANVGKLREPL